MEPIKQFVVSRLRLFDNIYFFPNYFIVTGKNCPDSTGRLHLPPLHKFPFLISAVDHKTHPLIQKMVKTIFDIRIMDAVIAGRIYIFVHFPFSDCTGEPRSGFTFDFV